MAYLSDRTLKKLILDESIPDENRILIHPNIKDIQIGQCSVDLTLSTQFARFRKPFFVNAFSKEFDPKQKGISKSIQKNWYKYLTVTEDQGIKIKPNELVIAITKEFVKLPKNMVGFITGRSSFSRMGIEIQLTQDIHQPAHNSQILLQIKNNSPFPIRLYPGMRIAQLAIAFLDEDCQVSYDENPTSKYKQGKGGIVANWFQDSELESKELIDKLPKYRIFLDAFLLILGLTVVITSIHKAIELKVLDVFGTTILSIGVLIILVRIIIFRSK